MRDRVVPWIDFSAINDKKERQTEKIDNEGKKPLVKNIELPTQAKHPRSLTEIVNPMTQAISNQNKNVPYKTFEKKSFA